GGWPGRPIEILNVDVGGTSEVQRVIVRVAGVNLERGVELVIEPHAVLFLESSGLLSVCKVAYGSVRVERARLIGPVPGIDLDNLLRHVVEAGRRNESVREDVAHPIPVRVLAGGEWIVNLISRSAEAEI